MEHYEKTMSRILPLHPLAVNSNMSDENLLNEAEIWCKPFACTIQGCSEPRNRTDEEKLRCTEAPKYLSMCINTVHNQMKEILKHP